MTRPKRVRCGWLCASFNFAGRGPAQLRDLGAPADGRVGHTCTCRGVTPIGAVGRHACPSTSIQGSYLRVRISGMWLLQIDPDLAHFRSLRQYNKKWWVVDMLICLSYLEPCQLANPHHSLVKACPFLASFKVICAGDATDRIRLKRVSDIR